MLRASCMFSLGLNNLQTTNFCISRRSVSLRFNSKKLKALQPADEPCASFPHFRLTLFGFRQFLMN